MKIIKKIVQTENKIYTRNTANENKSTRFNIVFQM
jgi:hypothetical protein